MPTENRSSNTEMVAKLQPCPFCGQQDAFVEQLDSDASVVICQGRTGDHSACLARGPVGVQQHECEDQPGHDQAVQEWNNRAAPQPHAEPIAWMVGTAFWWTKEEAERDAAATGLPIVGLGEMSGSAQVQQVPGEPVAWLNTATGAVTAHPVQVMDWDDESEPVKALYTHTDPIEVERLSRKAANADLALAAQTRQVHTLRAQLSERDALLREIADHCNGFVMPTEQLLRDWGSSIDAALAASAAPITPRIEPEKPIRCTGCDNCQGFNTGHDSSQQMPYSIRCDNCHKEARAVDNAGLARAWNAANQSE